MTKILFLVLVSASLGCTKFDLKKEGIKVGTEVGRFQMMQLSSMRRDQFLLDTATGKIWTNTCAYKKKGGDVADCDYSTWEPQDVVDINVTRSEVNEIIKILKGN